MTQDVPEYGIREFELVLSYCALFTAPGAERSNLIEVHLKVMRHLLGEFILWCATSGELQEHCLRRLCLGICSAVLGCKVWVVALKQLAKERILCASLTLRNLGMCL